MARGAVHQIVQLVLFISIATGLAYFVHSTTSSHASDTAATSSAAAAVSSESDNSSFSKSTSAYPTTTPSKVAVAVRSTKISSNRAAKSIPDNSPTSSTTAIRRIDSPYSAPPLTSAAVNAAARSALVNILCLASGGSIKPISGSGVIIDPRGVILTNAHVAQYVLLSESPDIDLHCYVRHSSPASGSWTPNVLYLPPIWVQVHASEILETSPKSTGEHDYALLWIASSTDGAPLPSNFPYLKPDAREAIAFQNDEVITAGYPAEFLGGLAATYALYAASSVTSVRRLMTLATNTVDELSLGGVIEAQGGSSGGAVVNSWGYLVGLIVTSSQAAETDERDLRALTLAYIDRDIQAQTGFDLSTLLGGDPALEVEDFTRNTAPQLIERYIKVLKP